MKNKISNLLQVLIIVLSMCLQKIIGFNNIELYLFTLLVIVLYLYTKEYKSSKCTVLFSILFSLFFTIGNIGDSNIVIKDVVFMIISFFGFYFLTKRLLLFLCNLFEKVSIFENNKKIKATKFILISTLIGLLCFLPYFLRFFPGIMTPDSFNQMWQIEGLLPYSNHHPWVHTMLIKMLYSFGYFITKSKNVGIAFYTVFQMIFVAFSFSYTIYILYKNNINKKLVLLVWLFFFLMPFNAIYSVTIWKDIIFSCSILLFSMFIWDQYYNNYKWSLTRKIWFCILSIAVCLFRSNGLIAYLIFLIVLFVFYRDSFKKIKYSIIISLVIVLIVKSLIMPLYKVKSPDFVESLSIPIQQVAYVIKTDGDISNNELKEIKKIASVKRIENDKYSERTFHVSDSTKNNIRANDKNHYLEKNKLKFLKVWATIGLKNPEKYIQAYVDQTSGYWYYNYGKYWVYRNKMKPGNNANHFKIEFYQDSLTSKTISNVIDNLLSATSFVYYKVWSPAMSFYVILFSLYLSIYRKKNVLPYILSISILITLLIATPVSCEFRYAYALFICFMPLFLVSLCKEKRNKKA